MWSRYDNLGNLLSSTTLPGAVATILNVMDYGAVGNGVTDDTTAIQAAINAAQTGGVSGRGVAVWFPSGVYYTSAALKVQQNNIALWGAGQGSTVIYPNFASGNVLTLGWVDAAGGDTRYSAMEFSDIQIFAPSARTTGAGIYVRWASDVRINNFSMNNMVTGILVGDTTGSKASIKVWIQNGTINNTVGPSGVGIRVDNNLGGDIYIGPNIVMSNGVNAPYAGIMVGSVGHLSVNRCNITAANNGMVIQPNAGLQANYLFIDHTLFDSCKGMGLLINGLTSTSKIQNLMSVNSWYSGDSNGIYTTGTAGATVSAISFIGCRILNNKKHGIVHSFGSDLSFTDCTISGNGQTASNTSDGFSVSSGIDGWQLMNCRIGRTGTASSDTIGRQRYAVSIPAGVNNNFSIIGNDVSGNGTAPFINNASTAGYGQIIHSNYPAYGSPGGRAARVAATAAINTTHTSIIADTIAPYRLTAGSTFRVWAWGTKTSTANASDSFMVRLGAATASLTGSIVAGAGFAMTGNTTAAPFRFEAYVTCRTIGASGTVAGMAQVSGDTNYWGSANVRFVRTGPIFAQTVNTTQPLLIELTYRSTSANSSNTFQLAGIDNIKV